MVNKDVYVNFLNSMSMNYSKKNLGNRVMMDDGCLSEYIFSTFLTPVRDGVAILFKTSGGICFACWGNAAA